MSAYHLEYLSRVNYLLSMEDIKDARSLKFANMSAYIGVSGHCCRFSSDSLRRDIFCNNILA